MKITEDYVSFEVAKLLKEKGFEQEADYATSWYANQYYKNACQGEWFEGEHQIIEDIDDKCNIPYLSERGVFIPAPTLQMACKWLREIHGYYIQVMLDGWALGGHTGYYVLIQKTDSDFELMLADAVDKVFYDTHEEAVESALKYVLENLI